ncbi:hypothetical protein Syun_023761 [Stephania yunnanensis]|uniref:Uncharacterized protein n=1 Tax=Stephania yunnanensis TaxID=152371 RepID=A0AAP0FD34_9MAGN
MATTATATATAATYDEVARDARLFMDTLLSFHDSLGTKFMVPTMGGKSLDLHRLFVEVTSRGGLEKVISNRQWKEIIALFNFPTTITNASFVLRKYYLSLLHRYEQFYYFGKQEQNFAAEIQAVTPPSQEQGSNVAQLPGGSEMWTGRWVTGNIDGKFDNGYIVTVSFGSEKLKGILYHLPTESSSFHHRIDPSIVARKRNRKKSLLAARDPSRPKPNRSGYNFFYSEHYGRLKTLHGGQEKTISSRIANLWSRLTLAEKQVYQEKGLKDKERYQSEMSEYRSSSNGLKS